MVAQLQNRLVQAQLTMEQDYERIRQIETRYRVLFETTNEALLIVSSETGRILDANSAAARLFAREIQDLTNRTFANQFDQESQTELAATLGQVRRDRPRAVRQLALTRRQRADQPRCAIVPVGQRDALFVPSVAAQCRIDLRCRLGSIAHRTLSPRQRRHRIHQFHRPDPMGQHSISGARRCRHQRNRARNQPRRVSRTSIHRPQRHDDQRPRQRPPVDLFHIISQRLRRVTPGRNIHDLPRGTQARKLCLRAARRQSDCRRTQHRARPSPPRRWKTSSTSSDRRRSRN